MRKYNPINSKIDIDESGKVTFKEEGPCWPGYKQVGTKMKNGKEVPNCVPIDEEDVKENKMIKGDANYKVVETKSGQIRLEFVNIRDMDVLMTKEDFKKLQKFINKVRV